MSNSLKLAKLSTLVATIFCISTGSILKVAQASEALNGEEVYVYVPKKTVKIDKEKPSTVARAIAQKRKKAIKRTIKTEPSNLPNYYKSLSRYEAIQPTILVQQSSFKETLNQLLVGSRIRGRVNHSIIAFKNEKSPVVMEIRSGPLRGSKLIGHSYLEPNTKRIFVEFVTLSHKSSGRVFSLLGSALNQKGQPGLTGKYVSKETKYFTGDFIFSFVSAYFDSQVPRYTNVFGTQTEDTSVNSAVKKGLAASSLSTAKRFKEKLKKAPEFSEISGPIDMSVLILKQAREI